MAMTQISSDTRKIQRYLSLYSRLRNKQKKRHLQIVKAVEEQYTLSKLLYFWRRYFRLTGRQHAASPDPEQQPLIYRQLGEDEIRLIKILPGNWNSPLQCELEHIAADDQVKYVALSYAWGSSNKVEWIRLNGRDHPIKASLAAALRRLRSYLTHGTKGTADTMIEVDAENFRLWADALCLNQNDLNEKQHQVPRMGTIFSRADDVYVWLQENSSDTDFVIQRTMHAANAIHASMDRKAAHDKLAELHGDDLDVIERGLKALFIREWFGRVWVIQELALARRAPIMIAGYSWTDADSLLRLLHAINPRPMERIGLHHAIFVLLMVQRQRYAKKRGTRDMTNPDSRAIATHLKAGLEHIGFFEASITHDYLYAILGLCTEGDLPAALAPSYNTPFEEVCYNYAKFIIEASGNLSILRASRSCGPRVPSWVPDFESILERLDGRALPAFVKFSACGRKMTVLGKQIGRCVNVHIPVICPEWMTTSTKRGANPSDLSQDPYLPFRGFQAFLQAVADIHQISLLELMERWLLLTSRLTLLGDGPDLAVFQNSQLLLLETNNSEDEASKETIKDQLLRNTPLTQYGRPGKENRPDLHSDVGHRQKLMAAISAAMDEEKPWPQEIQNAFDTELTLLPSLLTDHGMCADMLRVDSVPQVGDIVVCSAEEFGQAVNAALLRPMGSGNEYVLVGMVQPTPEQPLQFFNKQRLETAVPEEFVIV